MSIDREELFGKVLLRFPATVPIHRQTFLKLMNFNTIEDGIQWDMAHLKPWFYLINSDEIILNRDAYLEIYPEYSTQLNSQDSILKNYNQTKQEMNDSQNVNNIQNRENRKETLKHQELNFQTQLNQGIVLFPKEHHGFQLKDQFELNGQIYEIISEVARGGMGIVYRAECLKIDGFPNSVIIKYFQYAQYYNSTTNSNNCEQYWIQEAENTRIQSESPQKAMKYIEKFKDLSKDPPDYYIFLEFLSGMNLADWLHNVLLQNEHKTIQQIGPEGWIFIIEKILLPLTAHLAFIHEKGLIHRDITPKNILVMEYETRTYPVLIDWGVAKRIQYEKINRPKKPYFTNATATGTSIFNSGSAPEIIAGFEPVAATDVYMLGVIIYFIATGGKSPAMAATRDHYVLHPAQLNPFMPRTLHELVEKMTQYEPADRIRSMDEIVYNLRTILVDLTREINKSKLMTEDYLLIENICQNPYYILNWKAIKEKYRDFINSKVQLFEKQKPSPEYYMVLGYFACFKQELDIAWDYMNRSLELDENYFHGLALKAYILTEKGERDQAEQLLRQLNQKQPKNPFILYSLAKIIVEKGQIAEAEKYLDEALVENPIELNALNAKGIIRKNQGKFAEAEEFFNQCVRIAPDYIISWYNLGNLYKFQKKYVEAEIYYKKALERNPNYINALQNLAATEMQLGKTTEAQLYFDRITELDKQTKN
jgi:serine/threonine protein kinase/Flp pilus assembly protein TadD